MRYGSIVTDRLNLPVAWYTTVILSALFLSVNVLIRPQKYQTLYTNAESAENQKADMDWHIEFPKDAGIPDTDLCSVIGNLLENAVHACRNVPEEDRFIDLSITTTGTNTYLCIVMTNPFHGKLRKSGENYLSTRRNASGIGLSSVRSIAEQYGGVAKFSDKNGEFYSDVMMLIKTPTKTG